MAMIVNSGTTIDPVTRREIKEKERLVFNYKSLNDNTYKDQYSLPGTESFIVVYIDDILVFSKNEKEHVKHLEKMLKICEDNGLVLSPTKMKIAVSTVDFLGAVIGEGTIKLQPHIIKKIVNFNEEELKTRKGLRSVTQDIELSAAKEAVEAMQSLQAIIQYKAQICFDMSNKDNHWSDQREDVRIQNKEAIRILIELEALAHRLGRNNI
ncbi:ORFIII-like polyprotein [Tanacetum coccineum]